MEAEKRSIRNSLRRLRRVLPAAEAGRLSESICHNVRMFPHFKRALSVGLYLSVDNEVDLSSLLLAATLSKKAVFLPVVDKVRKSLLFARYRQGDPLVVGAFGIREPVALLGQTGLAKTEYAAVSTIDILFLPLVAFDRSGWRLGYGGGYYDRVLAPQKSSNVVAAQVVAAADKRPLLVGLAYHFQEVSALPYTAHDIPMDFVVTDQECIGPFST